MRKLRKGERYVDRSPQATDQNEVPRETPSPVKQVFIDKALVLKYEELLSAMAEEFRTIEFTDYSPARVIDNFWSRYNCNNTDRLNLFDMVLLAKGAVPEKSREAMALDSFVKDFVSFIIAGHTVHYMNRNYSAIGRYLPVERVEEIKEGVRLDFVGRLSGLR
ncbi:hypothetical protein G5B30_12225 [Sphingobacterium sp. SGG-5]|uniref:hypothetical protein n=1 Tax=Sphingobacterium sp. SGG-5 TaxID=2710881 RepID=UPI0013ED6B8E|nr:hypothetical protein [Sphingobacterium sp. SGG-5]NGM62682.1 hypothetical protein [Sphingobacterium sp. SGG-5]